MRTVPTAREFLSASPREARSSGSQELGVSLFIFLFLFFVLGVVLRLFSVIDRFV